MSILSVSSDRSRVILATMDVPTCAIVRGRAVEIDFLHPYFRRITSITVEEVEDDWGGGRADWGAYHVVRVAGADERWGFVFFREHVHLLFIFCLFLIPILPLTSQRLLLLGWLQSSPVGIPRYFPAG